MDLILPYTSYYHIHLPSNTDGATNHPPPLPFLSSCVSNSFVYYFALGTMSWRILVGELLEFLCHMPWQSFKSRDECECAHILETRAEEP